MFKKIQELMKQGKDISEITLELSMDESLDAKAIAEGINAAKKAVNAKNIADNMESKALESASIETKAKELAEEMLKKMPVTQDVKVIGEVKDAWKNDVGEQFHLMYKRATPNSGFTSKDEARLQELNEKAININSKATNSGLTATTAADAGNLIRREFESEISSLVYKNSELLSVVKFRTPEEKIAINGIGTVDFTFRTNDDTDYTKTKPASTQDTLDLKDVGALVAVSNRALQSAFYSIPGILAELFADAEIRKFEPLLIQGYASSDTFNGIHFTTGITTHVAKNNNGSGLICSADLTNMFAASKGQTRKDPSNAFVMRMNELLIIQEERDSSGQKLNDIVMVGDMYYHKPTGKRIIVAENLAADLNGTTNRSGSGVPVVFGPMSKLYAYSDSMKISTSVERYFEFQQTAFLASIQYAQTLASQTKACFVSLLGITNNNIPNI